MSKPKKMRLDDQPNYFIVMSEITLREIMDYRSKLLKKEVKPGAHLKNQVDKYSNDGSNLGNITTENFITLFLATKKPKFFAGKELKCDGSDWTNLEVKILGDINITMPVEIFDNGVWSVKDLNFKEHKPPLHGELLFTPGPLLKKPKQFSGETPEFLEVVVNNKIDQEKYNELMERRLSPLFVYTNEVMKKENCTAIVTIPGLGCGVFAGKFKGSLGQRLNDALKYILKKNCKHYSNIACIYYDPYKECQVESENFEGIKYRVRPFSVSKKPQMCAPQDYQEDGDDFTDCKLFKVVAWDHISYPGNNYFVGRRVTDDGMAAAATNSMEVITSIKGSYVNGRYLPSKGVKSWLQVVKDSNVRLIANGNVKVVRNNGTCCSLVEYEQSN